MRNAFLTAWVDKAASTARLRGSSFKVAYLIARSIETTGDVLCMSDMARHAFGGHRRSVQRAAGALIHLGLVVQEQRGTRVVLLPAIDGVALPLFEAPATMAAE